MDSILERDLVSPLMVVEGEDVTFHRDLASLEAAVEAPDVPEVHAYDATGKRLRLAVEEVGGLLGARIQVVRVQAIEGDPQFAEDARRALLRFINWLKTHARCEASDLEGLSVPQLTAIAVRCAGFSP